MEPQRRPSGMAWLFFSPSGRIRRSTFIKAWAFWSCLLVADIGAMFAHEHDSGLAFFTLFLTLLAPLATFSVLMLAWKRAQDMGAPGVLAILLLVPVLGLVMLPVLMAAPSQSGANAHGDMPDWPAPR